MNQFHHARAWFNRVRYSLSARLLLLFVIATIVLVTILILAFGAAFQRQYRDAIRPHIEQYLDYVLQDIGNPPDQARAAALAARLPVDIYLQGPSEVWASTEQPLDLDAFANWHRHVARDRLDEEVTAARDSQGRFAIRARRSGYEVYLLLGHRAPRHGGFWIGAVAIAVLVTALAICYALIRRLFQPLEPIQQGVRHFAVGDLAHRIQVVRRDELGELAASINAMATEIDKMLDAKRQLLLAISHELRSPLTRAKVNAALLEPSASRAALEEDLRDMETLLNELLESERLSGSHQVLNRQVVAVRRLIDEVITEHFSGCEVRVLPCDPDLYLLLDAMRIKLLLKNLLDNALRYSPADQPPELQCTFDQLTLILTVRDWGPGLEPEHLAHLTEPFYRVDPARRRQTGGYGLGLYLCRAIAEAHGGALNISSTPGQGTRIQVRLPVAGEALS